MRNTSPEDQKPALKKVLVHTLVIVTLSIFGLMISFGTLFFLPTLNSKNEQFFVIIIVA